MHEDTSRLAPYLNQLWHWLVEAGEASSYYAELKDLSSSDKAIYFKSWCRPMHKLDKRQLGQKLSAFKAWRHWCGTAISPFAPSPVQMASYIEHLSAGRPTAAQGAVGLLGWTARRAGLELHTAHPIVLAWTDSSATHTPRPQYPFKLKALIHCEYLARSSNRILAHFADAVLLCSYGTLRIAHLQRSSLLYYTAAVILGHCSQGKSKKGSAPFHWVCPTAGISYADWGGQAFDRKTAIHKMLSLPSSDYFLHAVGPRATDVTTASTFIAEAMPYSAYIDNLRRILQLYPLNMSEELAKRAGTYKARRVVPTIAGTIKMEGEELDSIGNWVENVSTSKGSKSRIHTMATHYNENKLRVAAVAKVMCLESLRQATQRAESYDLEWDTISLPLAQELRPQVQWASAGLHRPDAKAEIEADRQHFPLKPRAAASSGSSTVPPLPAAKPLPGPAKKCATAEALPTSSSSSSSSSADGEQEASDLEATGRHLDDCAAIEWVVPGQPNARIHLMGDRTPDALVTIYGCNKSLKLSSETGVGLIAAMARPNRWCPHCWLALPQSARDHLADEA